MKEEGRLGNGEYVESTILYDAISLTFLVPIVVVFTKFDELVPREMRKLFATKGNKLSTEQRQRTARENAEIAFKEDCLRIFQTAVGTQIPYKAVSSKLIDSCDPPSSLVL